MKPALVILCIALAGCILPGDGPAVPDRVYDPDHWTIYILDEGGLEETVTETNWSFELDVAGLGVFYHGARSITMEAGTLEVDVNTTARYFGFHVRDQRDRFVTGNERNSPSNTSFRFPLEAGTYLVSFRTGSSYEEKLDFKLDLNVV